MRTTPNRLLLVALTGWFVLGVVGAGPAAAAVTCGDLRTQTAARSYFEGPATDASRLDSDGDGRACEANTSLSDGRWTLLGLGMLIAVVYGRHRASERRRLDALAAGRSTWASQGSLDPLADLLRRVPPGQRMPLLEQHALRHGMDPQVVLDNLAARDRDLELQRWALVGYGAPALVRAMPCPCVGATRNFRLSTKEGERAWTCASCGSPAGHATSAINPRPLGTTRTDVDQR